MDRINEANTDEPSVKVIKDSYKKAFFWVTLIVFLGMVISGCINTYYPLGEGVIRYLEALSIIPGGTALWARWDINTWSGKSKAEDLNKKLYYWFSSFGLLCAVIAFSLKSGTV